MAEEEILKCFLTGRDFIVRTELANDWIRGIMRLGLTGEARKRNVEAAQSQIGKAKTVIEKDTCLTDEARKRLLGELSRAKRHLEHDELIDVRNILQNLRWWKK